MTVATIPAAALARTGSFAGPETAFYGAPLEYVHPKGNAFPMFDPEIEAMKGMTEQERIEAQEDIDALYGALVLAARP